MIDLTSIWLTLKVASFATLSAFTVGVAIAWIVSMGNFRGREWLDALMALPLVLPPTVLGYYLIVLFGRRGWLGNQLYETFGISLIFTWQGAVLAAAIVSLPLVYKSAKSAFEEVNKDFENAARTLGSSELAIFCRISFPLASRGILAGSMLAFARAMGEFGATLMIAGNLPGKTQTLSMAVYDAVQAGHGSQANILVLTTSTLCAFILYFAGKLIK